MWPTRLFSLSSLVWAHGGEEREAERLKGGGGHQAGCISARVINRQHLKGCVTRLERLCGYNLEAVVTSRLVDLPPKA